MTTLPRLLIRLRRMNSARKRTESEFLYLWTLKAFHSIMAYLQEKISKPARTYKIEIQKTNTYEPIQLCLAIHRQ